MKLFLLVLATIIFIDEGFSQTIVQIEIGLGKTFTKVDVKGANVDNDTARRNFIVEHLNTSKFLLNGAKNGKYTLKVYILVEKDGSIVDVRCENDPGYGMCEETINTIKRSPSSKQRPPQKVRPLKSTYVVGGLRKFK